MGIIIFLCVVGERLKVIVLSDFEICSFIKVFNDLFELGLVGILEELVYI